MDLGERPEGAVEKARRPAEQATRVAGTASAPAARLPQESAAVPAALLQHLPAADAAAHPAHPAVPRNSLLPAHPHRAAARYVPGATTGADRAVLCHHGRGGEHAHRPGQRAGGPALPDPAPGAADLHSPADSCAHPRCNRPAAWVLVPVTARIGGRTVRTRAA